PTAGHTWPHGVPHGAPPRRSSDLTAAAKAGLQKDDVIIRWNGEAVESARALSRHIHETPAGRSVKLGVLRNGNEMEVAVTLGDRDRKSTRLNSSHLGISYAVFCLK